MFPSLGNRLLEMARVPHGVTVLNVHCACDDIERLDFADDTFDAVLCTHPPFSEGPDMQAILREWRRVARAGGVVGFVGYGENAFQPLAAMLEARMGHFGVEVTHLVRARSWRLNDAEACSDLLRDAGFEAIEVRIEQLGYYLNDAGEWWNIVEDVNVQSPLSQLSLEQAQQFKAEHVGEIGALATPKGIWLDAPAIFAVGRKPGK